MLYFDQTIDRYIIETLNSDQGIVLHTTSWYLGPQISIPAGTTPQGTYSLKIGFDSLKTLCMIFLPQDYIQYPFLRKLYRINAGITSLQLKLGGVYYPSFPLKGQAGTSAHYSSSYGNYNNSEYLISLQKAFSKFNNKDEDISINQNNFAINERYWNPTTGFTQANTALIFDTNVTGFMPLIHENRCKGKAVYAIDMESLGDNKYILSGLNTKNNPIDVLITSNTNCFYQAGKTPTTNGATANVNMMFLLQYDMIAIIKKYSLTVIGRGGGI